jgi:ribonuclease Y
MEKILFVAIGISGFTIGIVVGYFIKRRTESISKREAHSKREEILESAKREADSLKEKKLLEAKEFLHTERTKLEKENRRWQARLKKQEDRIRRREQEIDRRYDSVKKAEDRIVREEAKIKKRQEEIAELKKKHIERLESLAGLSADEIKKMFIAEVEHETRYEVQKLIKKIEDEAKEEAENRAREIVAQAISRCAIEHVAESTVSVVSLPSDEMKGRVIGREGRNIRAFEEATGVELIIDDTPEAVTLSCYDPIRREVAKVALERLVADGRIHPGRIEEVVNKSKESVESMMKDAAQEAAFSFGIHDLTPKELELLGRLKFRTSYGQNVLRHSIEVAHLASVMAAELRVKNLALVKKAALLHDIGKALDSTTEGSHIEIAEEVLKQAGETPALINAVIAHHEDVEPESVEAIIVQIADALSAARPGARRETLEGYIKRLERLENVAAGFSGVEKAYAIQAGREIRVIVNSEEVDDVKTAQLAREIAKRVQSELEYPGSIKVTVIREKRVVEYAK